jgi:hypothetical protein
LFLSRNDYLTVLKALTSTSNPASFVSFPHKLNDINSRMPFTTFYESLVYFPRLAHWINNRQRAAF